MPKKGETYVLSWKHNLGQGAAPEILYSFDHSKIHVPNEDLEAVSKSIELAKQVTDAFKMIRKTMF